MRSLPRFSLSDQLDSVCLLPSVYCVCVWRGQHGVAPACFLRRHWSLVAPDGWRLEGGWPFLLHIPVGAAGPGLGLGQVGAPSTGPGHQRISCWGLLGLVPSLPQPLVCGSSRVIHGVHTGSGEPSRGMCAGSPQGSRCQLESVTEKPSHDAPASAVLLPHLLSHLPYAQVWRHFDMMLTHGLENDTELLSSVYFSLKMLFKHRSWLHRVHNTCS